MNITIILIALSIISILFLAIIRNKGVKSEALSFISTLIATLVGVLLAFTLTHLENQKKEKLDTIKLLNTARNILDGTYNYTNVLFDYITGLEKDTINGDSNISSIQLNNPIPYPDLMETIISNKLISKNLTEFSHNQVYNGLINMRKVSNYNSTEAYKKILKEQIMLLELEIDYQKGNLDLDEISEKFNSGRKELEKLYPNSAVIELESN